MNQIDFCRTQHTTWDYPFCILYKTIASFKRLYPNVQYVLLSRMVDPESCSWQNFPLKMPTPLEQTNGTVERAAPLTAAVASTTLLWTEMSEVVMGDTTLKIEWDSITFCIKYSIVIIIHHQLLPRFVMYEYLHFIPWCQCFHNEFEVFQGCTVARPPFWALLPLSASITLAPLSP